MLQEGAAQQVGLVVAILPHEVLHAACELPCKMPVSMFTEAIVGMGAGSAKRSVWTASCADVQQLLLDVVGAF